jgi:mycothiol synthase
MSSGEPLQIRPFVAADYEAVAEITRIANPIAYDGAAGLRRRDANFNPEHRRVRLVAEQDGVVVGWGQVGNKWWAYNPRTFQMRLEVAPARQQQGIGSQLYVRLAEVFEAWDPIHVRAAVDERFPRGIGFLQRRDFVEIRRLWESHLPVAEVDLARYASAAPRLLGQGLVVTTYAEELTRRGDRLARDLFDMEMRAVTKEPGYEAGTSMSFEQFRAIELESENALPEASFLALDGERLVGVSRVGRRTTEPEVLNQEFTGTDPDYQGRGIALALKVRTIEYAQAYGFREIWTQNDTANVPMLRINERLGFQRQPAIILFERT